MSSPLERDVRFHHNSLITLVDEQTRGEGGAAGKNIKTASAGGEDQRSGVPERDCVCGRRRRKVGGGKDPSWLHVDADSDGRSEETR